MPAYGHIIFKHRTRTIAEVKQHRDRRVPKLVTAYVHQVLQAWICLWYNGSELVIGEPGSNFSWVHVCTNNLEKGMIPRLLLWMNCVTKSLLGQKEFLQSWH